MSAGGVGPRDGGAGSGADGGAARAVDRADGAAGVAGAASEGAAVDPVREEQTVQALKLHVKGVVQGVGFRPFVYRLAQEYGITGWVLNATEGVFIHAEGPQQALDQFALSVVNRHPAAAVVDEMDLSEVPAEGFTTFSIRFSEDSTADTTTLVSADLATCDQCVAELFNPSDRRFRYPFINCTSCGPRFTIMTGLPYDRAATSMREFEMCAVCQAEYDDPANRRFHAQPDACFACGPSLGWIDARTAREQGVFGIEWADGSAGSEVSPSSSATPREAEARAVSVATEVPADADAPSVAARRTALDALIARAVELLREGGIVAVKGLGGYHLVCDASNPQAVARLRERKRREGKAFAVMMSSVDEARQYCLVGDEEAAQLTSPARPIVLLRKRPDVLLDETLTPGLADDLPELGVMLPATPVQHLLAHDFGGMLVMTSGNIHDEPIVTTEEDALAQLADVADAFLVNNRRIESRYDDSVVRVISAGGAGDVVQVIRRARGFAPVPVPLPTPITAQALAEDEPAPESVPASADETVSLHEPAPADEHASPHAPEVFATGPEQKNTFTFTRSNQAFVSQHLGDMESVAVMDAWNETRQHYQHLFLLHPNVVVCDKHPEYLTSKWAHQAVNTPQPSHPATSPNPATPALATSTRATELVPTRATEPASAAATPPSTLIEVQHHHAHVVAVMAENGLEGPVCGIAFDGTGYGEDGAIWGGEVLLVNLRAFERFANFAYIPLPGGAAAIKDPARIAFGALWEFDLLEHPQAQRFIQQHQLPVDNLEKMIERGINTPLTSSVGRLFDAVSALLGLCAHPRYEGEAAILLEAAVHRALAAEATVEATADLAADRYSIALIKNTASDASTAQDTSVLLFDAAPTFSAILDDLAAETPIPTIARRFHDALVQAIVTAADLVRMMYDISTVTLSGGVFMNRYLMESTITRLQESGFTVAINRDLPPNDASVSYGQAVVGLHTYKG